jgi:hypothetical protein
MGQRFSSAGDCNGQLMIQRQPQPIAGQRLVQCRKSWCQRQPWSVGEDLPVHQVLKIWAADPHPVVHHHTQS